MTRRQMFVGLLFLAALSVRPGHAQVSQRARQILERRACERDLSTCRPNIRAQLEAEERRIFAGLAALGALVFVGFTYLITRVRKMSAGGEHTCRR